MSYISHSPTRIPWRHFDLSTDLRLTFVYDTAKMWTEGIGTPPESELPGESSYNRKCHQKCTGSEPEVDLMMNFRYILPNINEDSIRWSIGSEIQDGGTIPWDVCSESSWKVSNLILLSFNFVTISFVNISPLTFASLHQLPIVSPIVFPPFCHNLWLIHYESPNEKLFIWFFHHIFLF